MKGIITTVKSQFRLFRQPHKIGDVIDVNGTPQLVLGIQRFEVRYSKITIWYTCQNLTKNDFVSKRKAYKADEYLEADIKIKHDDRDRLDGIQLGKVYHIEETAYQAMEFTEISLDGTDIYISFTIKPIHPIDRKEARAKYVNERRKKLSIEVIG